VFDADRQARDRRSFFSLLRRHIGFANERQNILGLLVVDIDQFSSINAVHGYALGDEILEHFGQILGKVCRKQDIVATLGADRFALILPRLLNQGHAVLAAHKLLRLLEIPFDTEKGKLRVHASIGIALCPYHATQHEFLLRKAERALRVARERKTAFNVCARADQLDEISDVWDIEIELDGAIKRSELELHYQPKIDARTGEPVGAEALMRWQSPSRGAVSPELFIPIAERTGQIKALTIWALNSALRHAGEWPQTRGPLSVSVNIPPEMVAEHDLPDLVENALKIWGKPHVELVLEITERTLVADPEHSFAMLSRIRELGVRISIDDFGTGYSCLAYFKDIPADELKIDRSFVAGMLYNQANRDITSIIIDLAHRFALVTVAEGVEDADTFAALRDLECDVIQGFLFGKPMRRGELAEWLQSFQYKKALASKTADR